MVHHGTRIRLSSRNAATVFLFGDRQQGSPGYCKEAWQEFRNEFKSTENAWALGLGDYGDWLRPSMRTPVINALAKDDSARAMLDTDVRRGHDAIIDEMEFLKGRLVGLHEGHHNWKFASGETTDQRLASALKAPFLGWIASTRLVFEHGNSLSGHVHMLLSTHGNANGRKVHSALAYLEGNYAAAWPFDSYAMGHGCKSGNEVPFKRNVPRRSGAFGVDVQIPRLIVVGGFADGYSDGWQSDYVERAGFTPQPLGYGLLRFKLTRREPARLLKGIPGRGSKTLQVEAVNRVLDL